MVDDPGLYALKNAVRLALVLPAGFAFALLVLDLPQAALFAAFGSVAMLVFTEFGGGRRDRLRAYAILGLAGLPLIALGTLCSRSTLAAVVAMAAIGFGILFAGVLNGYLAAAQTAAILAFVLAVMVGAGPEAIPARLLGWIIAAILATAAALLLWPRRPRDEVRERTAVAARALADLVEAPGAPPPAAVEASREAIRAARRRLVALRQRPSGTGGRTAALARLIEELGWLHSTLERLPPPARPAAELVATRARVERLVPASLRDAASALEEGAAEGARLDFRSLESAHRDSGRALLAALAAAEPGRDEEEAGRLLAEGYRTRNLAFAAIQVVAESLRAVGARVDDPVAVAESGPGPVARLARAHASMRSVWLRNSLRGAAGLTAAVLVAQLTDAQNSFWVVLGTLSVLRSDALATGSSILQALAGTLVGISAGGLLVLAVDGGEALLWAALPPAALLAAYAPRAISFLAGQAAFSLLVLVLFNLLDTGGWRVGLVRFEDVALGAGISLLVGVLFWPRGARQVLRGDLGEAYRAAAAFLLASVETMLGGRAGDPERAGSAAFASFQRLDATARDYLSSRGAGRRPLADLAVLGGGAARLRYVAGLMRDARVLLRLEPIEGGDPGLDAVRDTFAATLRGRCRWYDQLGAAIVGEAAVPAPERAVARGAEAGPIALERPGGGDGVPPGLALAWATLHLETLLAFEPALAEAARRLAPGAGGASPVPPG